MNRFRLLEERNRALKLEVATLRQEKQQYRKLVNLLSLFLFHTDTSIISVILSHSALFTLIILNTFLFLQMRTIYIFTDNSPLELKLLRCDYRGAYCCSSYSSRTQLCIARVTRVALCTYTPSDWSWLCRHVGMCNVV